MTAILRWFSHEGVRYRAYFRGRNHGGTADLILAGAGWQGSVTRNDVIRLEDFTDEDLAALVMSLRGVASTQ